MQVFKIKVSSLLIHSLITWIIIFGGMAVGVFMALLHANDIYFFLLILFGFSALVFLPELLSNASTEWSFSEKEIKIKWLSQFLFHKKSDAHFTWEDIQEYKYQPEKRFDLLELRLRDNTTFKYGHSKGGMLSDSDDFDKLISYFEEKVADFNDEGINFLHSIKRRKTIYETNWGLMLAIIMTILMIIFPILVAIKKPQKVDWIFIISAYSSSIYFISKVISYQRNKKWRLL